MYQISNSTEIRPVGDGMLHADRRRGGWMDWHVEDRAVPKRNVPASTFIEIFFFSGSAAQRELLPPRPRGFVITHNDAPQSVELLLDKWSARHRDLYWQNTTHTKQINIRAPDWIQTHNRSRRAAADPRLRPRCHWDRHLLTNKIPYFLIKI
jgi:hypothetical protein